VGCVWRNAAVLAVIADVHCRIAGSGRSSYRKSVRGPSRSQTGDATEKLQVIVDGVDRTPKPLLAARTAASKGGPEDSTTPNSDQSEFFMDRMSTAFSTKGGWFSNADSGTQTPKSEADYDYEGEACSRRCACLQVHAWRMAGLHARAGHANECMRDKVDGMQALWACISRLCMSVIIRVYRSSCELG
jgi:hypothetical protein